MICMVQQDRGRAMELAELLDQRLEKLVAERLPDIDIDEAIASTTSGSRRQQTGAPQVPRSSRKEDVPPQGESEHHEAPLSEAVPDAADGFDWQEEANSLADGMAALAVEPTGTGYLGVLLSALLTGYAS